jgi:hypothetical protein
MRRRRAGRVGNSYDLAEPVSRYSDATSVLIAAHRLSHSAELLIRSLRSDCRYSERRTASTLAEDLKDLQKPAGWLPHCSMGIGGRRREANRDRVMLTSLEGLLKLRDTDVRVFDPRAWRALSDGSQI